MGTEWLRTVSFPAGAGGAETAFWETAWAPEKQEAPAFLLARLRQLLATRRLVLEAGCGQGEFVRLLRSDEREVVGMDLAAVALGRAHGAHPELPLAVGDIRRLPFAPGAFDAIVSLGVVEHLEAGPVPALEEHRRALAPDGILVLTVPYRSWSRALADRWHLGVRRRERYRQRDRVVSRRRGYPAQPTAGFHQYEVTRAQLTRLLAAAGFTVTSWEAMDPATALTEADLVRRLVRRGRSGSEPTTGRGADADGIGRAHRDPAAGPGAVAWLRAAVLGHDAPTGRSAARLRCIAALAFGHLQLVVAVPDARPEGHEAPSRTGFAATGAVPLP